MLNGSAACANTRQVQESLGLRGVYAPFTRVLGRNKRRLWPLAGKHVALDAGGIEAPLHLACETLGDGLTGKKSRNGRLRIGTDELFRNVIPSRHYLFLDSL